MDSALPQGLDSRPAKDLLGDLDVGISELATKPLQPGLPDPLKASPEPLVKSEHEPLFQAEPELKKSEPEPLKSEPEPLKSEPEPLKSGPEPLKNEPELPKNEPELPKFEHEPQKSESALPHSEPEPPVKSQALFEPRFESTLTSPSGEKISEESFTESKEPAEEPLSKSPSPSPEISDFHDEVSSDPLNVEETFGFNKPLPPEPHQAVSDFLKSEINGGSASTEDKDDDLAEFVGARGDSPATFSREESPIPPPVPKHQNIRDESPDRFESSPEPEFKPMDSGREIEEPEPVVPVRPPKPEEPNKAVPKEEKKTVCGDIGAKDLIVEIDAWFNPARLHPQVESLVYWRDPRKSGVVFGVLLVTLLSLTSFSLISVIAYFGLIALAGTISFRVYKNIMQAVQKTSDGHPFKDLLQLEISLSEDKVAEISRLAAQQLNAAISTLRSLFLVEDLIDSIKGLVLFWALTYIGALFNGLTLLIIGVILVFALPRLYEMNKDQVDAYIQIAQDKLSIVTNRMKAAIPSAAKKEEKPKDQ